MSSYKFTPRAVASPDAPQKPLARKRARSGGELYRFSTGAGHLFIHTDGCCSEFLNWGFVNLFDKLVQWRWFHRITWCVFIKGHSYNLCDAAARAMAGWLAGAYRSSASHTDHQQQPVLIRDDKVKWLDFGSTPDPVNLQPHPGYVWLKSGYSEAIPWRKVGLIKQRNVDLTTDGLWAMPLNEGWVPVKARRLQDWQKLKKYVPVHKQGDVCPNGVPALPEKSNADSDSDSE